MDYLEFLQDWRMELLKYKPNKATLDFVDRIIEKAKSQVF